jgi:phosphoribosylaminoimidazole-succinocarboxamide synthase
MTDSEFYKLPLVIKGESKEVRYLGGGDVVIKFLPTIYSFSSNRCEIVPNSDIPRIEASKKFISALQNKGIKHAYYYVENNFIIAQLVMPSEVEFKKYGLPVFVPPDLSKERIENLPKAPPIEIIVKRYLTGTTKHQCDGLVGTKVRSSHPFYSNFELKSDGPLPEMLVRFDWRNPLRKEGRGAKMLLQIMDKNVDSVPYPLRDNIINYGDRVADVCIPEQIADLFIDVERAKRTAFMTGMILENYLAEKDIVFCDLCLFITESGDMLYGEISPDCGRYRHLNYGELDKDVWRAGGSSEMVLEKWNLLVSLLKGEKK